MSPKSIRGKGSSLHKKTPQERQQQSVKRVHASKYQREEINDDIRNVDDPKPLPFNKKKPKRLLAN